jgi:hypothetical protein
MELNRKYQLLAYAYGLNLLEDNMDTTKKKTNFS